MTDVRCAIFDADGTLLDSMAMWDKLDDEFLARRGIPSDPVVNQELHGMYFEECPAYFRKKFGLVDLERMSFTESRLASWPSPRYAIAKEI